MFFNFGKFFSIQKWLQCKELLFSCHEFRLGHDVAESLVKTGLSSLRQLTVYNYSGNRMSEVYWSLVQ